MDKKTVCVGMSGGVDSSVAAYLLKEQGYNVIGVTMQIWQDEDADQISEHGGCCGLSAVDDARRVAAQLEIPYYVMNFKEDFRKYVIDYFVDEYRNGRTPNPWQILLLPALCEHGKDAQKVLGEERKENISVLPPGEPRSPRSRLLGVARISAAPDMRKIQGAHTHRHAP